MADDETTTAASVREWPDVSEGVHRIGIDGGLRIASDGTYSSEYHLPLIHAKLADELVRMEYRRDVILAFRKAHDFPKGTA